MQQSQQQSQMYVDQISSLSKKVTQLESKCFTIEMEKTHLDETLLEANNAQQTLEIENMKNKQHTEKIMKQQSHIMNLEKRNQTLEKKNEMQVDQITSLKS